MFFYFQMKVDSGDDISDASVLDLASLLKQFFREMPEPLLTLRLRDSFLTCYDISDVQQRLSAVFLLCLLLPERNLAILRYLTAFLHRVADNSDQNKMNISNIAVCFAPNIFQDYKILTVPVDGETAKTTVAASTCIMELFIEHASRIGEIDPDLQQRLELMTSCFNESEMDDDTELDITETREKKRSGSFQGLCTSRPHFYYFFRYLVSP